MKLTHDPDSLTSTLELTVLKTEEKVTDPKSIVNFLNKISRLVEQGKSLEKYSQEESNFLRAFFSIVKEDLEDLRS